MQLCEGEATFVKHFTDGFPTLIDKHPNGKNKWRELRNNAFGDGRFDTSRTFGVKYESQCIDSGFNRYLCVFGVGNTADFYFWNFC